MLESYYFKSLERHELDECLKMVTRLFFSYDPFISELKLTEHEFFKRAKVDFKNTLDDEINCNLQNEEQRKDNRMLRSV